MSHRPTGGGHGGTRHASALWLSPAVDLKGNSYVDVEAGMKAIDDVLRSTVLPGLAWEHSPPQK